MVQTWPWHGIKITHAMDITLEPNIFHLEKIRALASMEVNLKADKLIWIGFGFALNLVLFSCPIGIFREDLKALEEGRMLW